MDSILQFLDVLARASPYLETPHTDTIWADAWSHVDTTTLAMEHTRLVWSVSIIALPQQTLPAVALHIAGVAELLICSRPHTLPDAARTLAMAVKVYATHVSAEGLAACLHALQPYAVAGSGGDKDIPRVNAVITMVLAQNTIEVVTSLPRIS